ncbi:MAG: hypothetical protein AAB676_18915 [Verrucomicrobiota bacterium]
MNKLLRNPYAVGLFVLLAVFLVYRTLFPRRPAPPKTSTNSPPAALTVPQPLTTKVASPEPQVLPANPIDLTAVDWIMARGRDPFKRTLSAAEEARQVAGAAPDILNLSAIWRQTGGRFAVINGQIVGEGETIEGFKVQSIENDSVQVQSPTGLERVSFKIATPPPAAQPIPTPPPARPQGKTDHERKSN